MKTLVIVFICIIFWMSQPIHGLAGEGNERDPPAVKGKCPVTQIVGEPDDCLKCHIISGGKFTLKETVPDAHFAYPNDDVKIFTMNGKQTGYFLFTEIDPNTLLEVLRYFDIHNIRHVILEIFSPGGNVMEAWRAKGIIDQWKNKEVIIETRVNGLAASAGFVVFVSGTKGYRFANPNAELMWHEIMNFKLFSLETPSSTQEQSRIMRHLQDNIAEYLTSVSKMTKEEIDDKVSDGKEFWMTGREALDFGFVDHLD